MLKEKEKYDEETIKTLKLAQKNSKIYCRYVFKNLDEIIANTSGNPNYCLTILENSNELEAYKKRLEDNLDYVSSYIKNKHIQDQAVRLSAYNYYACIVHGNILDLKRIPALRKISQDSINKMTANLMLFYKLPIFFVEDEKQYLKLALLIANAVGKHHGKELSSVTLATGIKTRPDISILASQNNIGVQKAKLLLDEFGSPSAVLNASREDLLKVKGVGDAMVANIQELKDIFENGVKK